MAEATFYVTYDGAALADNSMDIRQLAPSLLALGEFYQEVQRQVSPDQRPVALEVRATQPGSFNVHLVLTESLWDQAISLFSGDVTGSMVNLLEIGGAVFGLIAWAHQRRIRNREALKSGDVRITAEDGATLVVPKGAMDVASSLTIRQLCRDIVRPLGVDGIDTFRITHTSLEVVVHDHDLPAFELPPMDDEVLSDSTSEVVVSAASVAFTDGNKWRLSDGERTFYASVDDEHFLARVSQDEVRFAKHDLMRVVLRTVQRRSSDGQLSSTHNIVRVIEHIPAARQVPLPFDLPD